MSGGFSKVVKIGNVTGNVCVKKIRYRLADYYGF
jgi:hypothetical protein